MRRILHLLVPILFSQFAAAQNTIDFTGKINLNDDTRSTNQMARSLMGTGTVGTLGKAALQLTFVQNELSEDYSVGVGPIAGSLLLIFNSQDQIQVNFGGQPIQDPNFTTIMAPGTVSPNNSRGVYSGATSAPGAIRFTFTRTSVSPLRYNVSLTGSAVAGGQTVVLTITEAPVTLAISQVTVVDNDTGTCEIPALGSGTLALRSRPDNNRWGGGGKFIELVFSCSFSESDTLRGILLITAIDEKTGTVEFGPVTFAGSSGRFAGAGGTGQLTNLVETADGKGSVTISGSLTLAGPATPIITSVTTPYWLPNPMITQNGWIQIKGTNLVPASTPAGGMFWSGAPEFAQGRMPTETGGVGVTVNGKAAYVWWFCSKASTPACAEDQINVLTPLDDYLGVVTVAVKNGTASSGAFLANKRPITPSILRFSARGHAVATHPDGRLLGPLTLYPGQSTPGARGETVSLWTVGLGLPRAELVAGASAQTGLLPFTPACFLGGDSVQVTAALVSPGLYQLNVTIPMNASPGDNIFYCTAPESWTLPALIAVAPASGATR